MTKLQIQFHSFSQDTLIPSFAEMIAKHNAGMVVLNLIVMEGYFKAMCARFGYYKAITHLDKESGELTLSIEAGKPFVTISEHELIGELSPAQADLLIQGGLS